MGVNITKRVFKNARIADRIGYVVVDQRQSKSFHVGCRDTRAKANILREAYILSVPDSLIRKNDRFKQIKVRDGPEK